MNTRMLLLAVILALAPTPDVLADESRDPAFDAALAAELGADDYGMRRYVLVILKAGSAGPVEPEEARRIQRGHMENINRLADEGRLVLAGPFIGAGEARGLFVFDVDSVEAARELTATDPAIVAGRLEAEYLPWYGSAALKKVTEIHGRIARESP